MENFQLYRTNILLSGQLKWDIIVDSKDKDLYIRDFHITPVSDNVPYAKYSTDSLLNYNHYENIKSYYREIQGSFYENYSDMIFNHDWPVIRQSSDEDINKFDQTLEMGCRRSLYELYNKQFEFFCPIWIEKLSEPITFIIKLSTNGNIIASKALTLKDISDNTYHNRFIKYFYDYIKYLELDKGNDEVININLSKKQAYLTGVDVGSGNNVVRDISPIVNNILYRERPLMEVDDMIINSFKNTKTIAKQLFNFNICFNIEDILTTVLSDMMYGNNITISLDVKIGNELLEKRDFFTNYELIPRSLSDNKLLEDNIFKLNNFRLGSTDTESQSKLVFPWQGGEGYIDVKSDRDWILYCDEEDIYIITSKINVFNYLRDNTYIDFMNKNKFSPNIIHWSLRDNNDYIFNLYTGFNGYSFLEDRSTIQHSYLYDNTPDIIQSKYSPTLNNVNWAKYIETDIGELQKILSDYMYYCDKYAADFNNEWVNNIKYRQTSDVKVMLIYLEDGLSSLEDSKFISLYKDNKDSSSEIKYIIPSSNINFIIFISDNKDLLTFASMRDILKKLDNNLNNLLKSLYTTMLSVINNPIVVITRGLDIKKTDSPSLSSKEIEYYKNNNMYIPLMRYDGNIKPTFIKTIGRFFNHNYFKQIINIESLRESVYNKYSETGYPPLYPSIGYYATRKQFNIDYDNSPYNNPSVKEYKWFNNNNVLLLRSDISTTLYSRYDSDGKLVPIKDLIIEYLKNIYNINSSQVKYIYNLYKYDYLTDYINNQDIKNYKYRLNITLK